MLTTILALLLAQQPPEDPSPPAPPSVTCEGEGYDAFDFWVGEWDVYPTGSDTKVSQAVEIGNPVGLSGPSQSGDLQA